MSTFPWRAPGKRRSEAGRKGDKRLARSGDRPKQVAMDNESEGVVEASGDTEHRMENLPNWLIGRTQKGTVSGHVLP